MEADRVLTATERLAKRLGKPVAKPKQSPGLPVWTPVEKKQLELKLQSLHEVYAKKVAETELQYDKKLEEAEAEAQRWFKEKKAEITTLKAGVTIMQAFFEHRKRKFLQQLAEDRAENERLRVEMAERGLSNNTPTERAFRAERAVKLGDAEISRLQDVEKSLRFEIEDLRVRLQESERAEELHRAKEKAEFLEEELRKTRERMRTQRHLEAEELRRELMDYVKFIVKILPEEP
eukprot:g18455.t1